MRPVALGAFASKLEARVFAEHGDFNVNEVRQDYLDAALLLHSAFSQNDLLCLQARFLAVAPAALAVADVARLESRVQAAQRRLAEEAIRAARDLSRFVTVTGIECKKCRLKTVMMTETQSRSSDEATTLVYQCTSCGFKWSKN